MVRHFYLAAGTPITKASKEVTVASLATTDRVVITPSSTAVQSGIGQNSPIQQFTYQVVKESGKFTVYADQYQTPSTVFDYIVLTNST